MVISNTERCWYVNICDEGAFRNYRTSEASVVILKSAQISNVYIHSRVRYGLNQGCGAGAGAGAA